MTGAEAPGLSTDTAAWLISIGLILLIIGALALFLWQRHHAQLIAGQKRALTAERLMLKGLLERAPSAWMLWPARGEGTAGERDIHQPAHSAGLTELLSLPLRTSVTLSTILTSFIEADSEKLRTAMQGLQNDGIEFRFSVQSRQRKKWFLATGRRLPLVGDSLWLTDITEPVQDVERQRDGLLRLLDALPVSVWMRQADLKLTYCNIAYAEAADSSREMVLARQIEIADGLIPEGGRALARRARDFRIAQSESQHIMTNGRRRLWDFTETPLPDLEGDDARAEEARPVRQLAGYAFDMTSLEQGQDELARHIAAHAEVLEQLGTAIVILRADSRVHFFNSAFLNLFDLSESFLGNEPSLGELLEALRERRKLPEQANFPIYKQELERRLMGVIRPFEDLLHLPDDSTLRLLVAPHPFGGVLILVEDVTDRLALERSYNTLIEVQRTTLDHLHEGVAVFGADGRLRLSNPAFAQQWGLQLEDLRNEPHVSEVVDRLRDRLGTSTEWAKLRTQIIELFSEGESREGRMEQADGTVLQFIAVALPDGGCLFTAIDVTDSIRAERALADRAEALETADRLKSEFLANVSYELRTPLNAIIGFAEILHLQYFGPLNARQQEYSHNVVEASQRLLALINNILDIATIEAGYLTLTKERINLAALLKSLEFLTAERLRTRGLSLVFDCPPDVGDVLADEKRLRQAIYNLISNAINFTPDNGRITVTARRSDDGVAITVNDTGIGIAEADQRLVFEKFSHPRGGGPRQNQGVGLGLALVKRIIELHGGSVSLHSRPGEGTSVTCHLPDRASMEAPAPPQ